METKFNLSRYQGREVRVRFLFTSIKVGDNPTALAQFQRFDDPVDDGWFIDDVRLDPTLTTPATVAVDTADNGLLPACGTDCNTLTAVLSVTPAALPAPGHVTELDASASTSDRCLDGVLQYQFWLDNNTNGVLSDAGDTLMRNWTDNAILLDTPNVASTYGVAVRCSSDPDQITCSGSDTQAVTVNCPSTGTLGSNFPNVLEADTATDYSWGGSLSVDVSVGSLNTLRSGGNFTGSVNSCLLNDATASGFTDATDPGAGNGLYYLARLAGGGSACNATNSYSSGGAGEAAGRDAQIGADASSCP